MGTVNVVLGEDTRLNLILGQQLENAVTSVVFDFSAWQTTYGAGTLALSVQRPGDEMPYAVVLTTSGTDATWSVTNLDTAYKGVGHIQLTYTVGSAIKKSVVYKFTVYESLGANGEYPSPGQTWQEEMEQEITDVKSDLADIKVVDGKLYIGGVGYELGGVGITSIAKTGTSGLVDTYTITMTDETTYTFTVTNGDANDAKIQDFIEDWLDEHPEATTTVQDGSITQSKLSPDLVSQIESLSFYYDFTNYNELIETKLNYQAWPLQCVSYDDVNHEIVCCVAEQNLHTNPTIAYRYIVRIDPRTLEVLAKTTIYDLTDSEATNTEAFEYMRMFAVKDGTYYKCGILSGVIYCASSSDKGITWTKWVGVSTNSPSRQENNGGLLIYNNGRWILENYYNMIAYSDDNMVTWTWCDNTPSSANTRTNVQSEADIICNGNNLMRIMRHSWSSTTGGEWNDAFHNEPADISYSTDNGVTWSQTVASRSIIDMSANNCCHVVKDGIVHLFVGSRRPYLYEITATIPYGTNTKRGHIDYYIATIDDAFDDNFTFVKTIYTSQNIRNDDFSGIWCCMDAQGVVHLFFGDNDRGDIPFSRWKYLRSNNSIVSLSENNNTLAGSYKKEVVDLKLSAINAKMMSLYNELLLKIGELPDPGDDPSAPSYWVTEGLLALYLFEEKYWDSSTNELSPTFATTDYKSSVLKLATDEWNYATPSTFNSKYSYGTTAFKSLIEEICLNTSDGYTIEFDIIGSFVTNGTGLFSIGKFNIVSYSAVRVLEYNEGTSGSYNALSSAYDLRTATGSNSQGVFSGRHTMTLVFDKNNLITSLYFDGVLKTSANDSDTSEGYSLDMSIGNSSMGQGLNPSSYFKAIGIEKTAIRFYNRPLTSAEIESNSIYTQSLIVS